MQEFPGELRIRALNDEKDWGRLRTNPGREDDAASGDAIQYLGPGQSKLFFVISGQLIEQSKIGGVVEFLDRFQLEKLLEGIEAQTGLDQFARPLDFHEEVRFPRHETQRIGRRVGSCGANQQEKNQSGQGISKREHSERLQEKRNVGRGLRCIKLYSQARLEVSKRPVLQRSCAGSSYGLAAKARPSTDPLIKGLIGGCVFHKSLKNK